MSLRQIMAAILQHDIRIHAHKTAMAIEIDSIAATLMPESDIAKAAAIGFRQRDRRIKADMLIPGLLLVITPGD